MPTKETGMAPQIVTSDNVFKIILPNLNAKTEQKFAIKFFHNAKNIFR